MFHRLHRPRTLLATLATGLAAGLALPLALPGAAHAQRAETWDLTGATSVQVDGRGYGHGHGLSQYGAEGAARAGLGYRDIVGFYYAGTEWGTQKGAVKVHITGDTSDDVVVRAHPGLRVKSLSRKKTWHLPDRDTSRWRLKADRSGRTVVQWRKGSRWKQWRSFRGLGEFSVRGARLELVTPSGTTSYRGKLRSAGPTSDSRRRDTVNVLSLENYLKGVVPLEIPASWSPEAVKAQAIAARTYAAYERAHPLARHYQICDTTQCQVYGGASAEHPLSNAAIAATRHEALTAGGEPAFTQFSSSSGGWTSAGSVPYLVAQEDPYDGWAGNPVHSWSTTVGTSRLQQAWPSVGKVTQLVVEERDGNGEWGGRVVTMRVVGDQGEVTVSGDDVRSALGLRSSWFTFEVVPGADRRAW